MADEAGQVERAQAREQPVVPAPLNDVHVQLRGVRKLYVEHLGAGNDPDPCGVVTTGQDMKAVETQAERTMVGMPDDPPGVCVGVDEPAPRQRFVRDAQAALVGPIGQGVQLLGGEVVVVHRVSGYGRAGEHCRYPELFQHVELALGSAQVGLEQLGRDRLEVAERLVYVDVEAPPFTFLPHSSGGPRRRDEVILEDLDPVEACRGSGGQLVLESSGKTDRGDGQPRGSERLVGQDIGFSCTNRTAPFGHVWCRHGSSRPQPNERTG